jgi:hypothetical protein
MTASIPWLQSALSFFMKAILICFNVAFCLKDTAIYQCEFTRPSRGISTPLWLASCSAIQINRTITKPPAVSATRFTSTLERLPRQNGDSTFVLVMQAYEQVEMRFHSFLNSALDGVEWSASRPGRFSPGKLPRYPLNRLLSGCTRCDSTFRRQKSLVPSAGRTTIFW